MSWGKSRAQAAATSGSESEGDARGRSWSKSRAKSAAASGSESEGDARGRSWGKSRAQAATMSSTTFSRASLCSRSLAKSSAVRCCFCLMNWSRVNIATAADSRTVLVV